MATIVTCQCGKTLQIPEGTTARRGKCPACGSVISLRPVDPPRSDAAVQASSPSLLREVPPAQEPVSSPVLRHQLEGTRGAVTGLSFSRDAQLLASSHALPERGQTASRTGEIDVWDVQRGQHRLNLHGYRNGTTCVALSPGGDVLAAAGNEQSVTIWDLTRGMWDEVFGQKARTLAAHQKRVTCLAFSPDGSRLATAGDDQQLRLWNTASWQPEPPLAAGRKGDCAITFSSDGRLLAAAWKSRGPVIVWDVATREEHVRLKLPSEEDQDDLAVALAPNGQSLVVLSTDEVRYWDLSSVQVLVRFSARHVTCLAVSPGGLYLAVGSSSEKGTARIRFHDLATGEELCRLDTPHKAVTVLAFSTDGHWMASGGPDGGICLWAVPPLTFQTTS